MAFGLVCIGSQRGLMPWMLGDGRGFIVPRDARALAAVFGAVLTNREASAEMAQRAAAWAQRHPLEGLRDALRTLLAEWWKDAR